MSKYALLALDMDGTLLDDDHVVSQETANAIAEAQQAGVTVMLSTGRAIQNALPYAEELGLNGPLIVVNGSEIWRNPQELYMRYLLDRDAVQQMLNLSEKYDTWFWAYSTKALYNREKWSGEVDQEDWLKFGYYNEDVDVLSSILAELQAIGGLELTNSALTNIEINPAGISKASGIRTVCELLGIEMSQVVAVGDSLNDLAVIQQAGLGVAMGNAQDAVKQAADVVVASNNEHGVAEVIRRFIL
ncbi:Cof-type HAD-IIB family hydrolase [Paenibacillus agilis]|uniref:HAD family phosphatase n=1 Tax=Paenibacillus agilis TaxID=3020863 RepID=A0A559IHE4_9BACL|nr:Cof-type HAD-IIB family hydrolase [Paenibacillus agilis]TVX87099.1 HAD family phosphatase [Paenibacillus agilis]